MNELRYTAAQEETIFFELPHTPGMRIKGIARGDMATQPVAVMMHGRPGGANSLLQYLGARVLSERGIATLRLSMYGNEPDTRNLIDCTLQTHVDDFDVVVKELRAQGVKQIFGIGHSYGGLTILKSNAMLESAVLWDPAHGSWWTEGRDAHFQAVYPEEQMGEYIIGVAGAGYINGSMAARAYDEQLGDTSAWAAKPYPLQIVSAGKGALTDLADKYMAVANEPKRHVLVPDAHHSFEDSDEVMLNLFDQTLYWLARTSPWR